MDDAQRIADNVSISEYTTVYSFGGYGEMFEVLDDNLIECGHFVTLDGRKIKKANKDSDYILGITSLKPAILACNNDVRWKKKYLTDEWGTIQYEEKYMEEIKDKNGRVLVPAYTVKQPIINPNWDKDRPYVPRTLRDEWVAVIMLGEVIVRDNGECVVNGYCKCGDDGIAVPSNFGYRVIERLDNNRIIIIFKL